MTPNHQTARRSGGWVLVLALLLGLGAGIGIVECLTNLGEIKSERPLFIAAPLKIIGGDASPVRALAIDFD